MHHGFTEHQLARQQRCYRGTGGLSQENQGHGFRPAFLDAETGTVYDSCYADGRPAPVHFLDGLPAALVLARSPGGRVTAVKGSVLAGFIHGERFYTREETIQRVMSETQTMPLNASRGTDQPGDSVPYPQTIVGLAAVYVAAAQEAGWLALHLSWSLACSALPPRLWKRFWLGSSRSAIDSRSAG